MSPRSERKVVILSDIEMGAGDKYDDFKHTDFFADFLERYNTPEHQSSEIDLVFNGDTFDLLKVDIGGQFPHIIDEYIAMTKFARILNAHELFFKAVQRFIEYGNKPRRVHFIVGNHDMELLFPRLQEKIIQLCGGSGQIFFPGFSLTLGDLYIEHGNQRDSLFSVDPQATFIEHEKRNILRLPWATVTLLNVVLPHRADLFMLDRIKPRNLIFESIPELREYLLGLLWRYWAKDYIRSNDPLKRITWSMVKETLKRSFYAFHPDVEINHSLDVIRSHNPNLRTFIFGHLHDSSARTLGNSKIIQSGCFRDEFMLLEHDMSYRPIPKSFIEVQLISNRVSTVDLREIVNPHLSPEEYPKPLEHYNELIAQRLGPSETRIQDQAERQAHEAKENSLSFLKSKKGSTD